MGDSATPGSSYSSYSKYRGGRGKMLMSDALWSYRMPLGNVNVAALQASSFYC